jgi:hypothetical protein
MSLERTGRGRRNRLSNMANTCEVAITSLLATLGFVQESFRSKVVELQSSDAAAEASWERR